MLCSFCIIQGSVFHFMPLARSLSGECCAFIVLLSHLPVFRGEMTGIRGHYYCRDDNKQISNIFLILKGPSLTTELI